MENILKKIVWLFIIAPAVYLAIVWDSTPERIPMHYDLQGNVDRIGPKKELIGLSAVLTGVTILVYLLLINVYRIDPKRHAVENKPRLFRIAFAVAVFTSAVQAMMIYSSTKGTIVPGMGAIFAAAGLLFAIIGNYMPNLKPNYFAGFRLPWTLENEENWRKTHFIAGKLWFAGGLLLAVICLFMPPLISIISFFTIMSIMVIIPLVFSYRLYKKQKLKGPA